jgi:hypothetical protein
MVFMKKVFIAIVILLLLSSAFYLQSGKATTSVGVKSGDWIEFNANTTGNLPAGHDVIWFKMEIINITGTQIFINIIAESRNGTLTSAIRTIDFASGDTQAWIIIPANLGPGDSFYDNLSNSTVTIQGEKTETIDGTARTITYVHTPQRNKEWDKATGVFVQTVDNYPDYNVTATSYATNMWAPKILGLDPTVFYAITIVILIAIADVVVIIAFRRKK